MKTKWNPLDFPASASLKKKQQQTNKNTVVNVPGIWKPRGRIRRIPRDDAPFEGFETLNSAMARQKCENDLGQWQATLFNRYTLIDSRWNVDVKRVNSLSNKPHGIGCEHKTRQWKKFAQVHKNIHIIHENIFFQPFDYQNDRKILTGWRAIFRLNTFQCY